MRLRAWLVGVALIMGLGVLAGFLVSGPLAGSAQSGSSLLVQATVSPRSAAPGNTEFASVYATVQSSSGLMEGLSASNFTVFAEQLPPQGCLVNVTQLRTTNPGVYRLDIVPGVAGCLWRRGEYVLSISVRSGSQSGAGLAILTIP
jgi:hypothetical protein